MKTVLDLNNKEAYNYFMSPDNYCNIPLPPYFKFDTLLKYVAITSVLTGYCKPIFK